MKKVRAIVESSEEPEDRNVLWLDISNIEDICIKIYAEGEWVIISTSGIFGNYITPTDLQNALNSYVTQNGLTQALNSALTNYVTTTNLSNTLSELHVVLTEAAYTALEEKNPNTFYYTYEEE